MLTGLYPPVHGVRDNGTYRLPRACQTLAETLRDAGYVAAAEVAALVLNREFGLNQGFAEYRDAYTPRRVKREISEWVKYRVAEEISLGVIELLHERGNEPFFIFAHFFDPHQPYEAPEPYRHQYAEKYQAEVAYMDAEVGRILRELDTLGLRENTLVVFTSDHGESLWQHGEETHGAFVYDATMVVPLVMRCPGVIPADKRVAAQVRLIDIAPTILDYLGIEGLAKAQGTSLRPLITGAELDLNLTAYSESFYPVNAFGMSHLRAVRAGGWKYIHAPKPELYDLRADPQELHNLIATESARADGMREWLRTLLAESPPPIAEDEARIQLPPDTLAELRGLGYVGAPATRAVGEVTSELDMFEPRGADPKDYTDLISKVSHLLGHVQQDLPQAEQGLRECIARAPNPDAGFAWAFASLAELLMKEERWDEAAEWYERAVRRHPDDGRALTGLGDALMRIGRVDDALAAHRAAVQLEPVMAHSCFLLANALVAAGEFQEAVTYYKKSLEIDSAYTAARIALARLQWQLGRTQEAKQGYDDAIAHSPAGSEAQRELGNLLLSTNQVEEALPYLRAWADLEPLDALARATVGDALRALVRHDEAVLEYQRALALDPKQVRTLDALGQVLIELGSWRMAEPVLRQGLVLEPEHANLANNLAWLLATAPIDELRCGTEAVNWADIACRKTAHQNIDYLDTLAAAYAETGRFEDAIDVLERAVALAVATGQEPITVELRQRIKRYREGRPMRSPAG